MIITHGDKCDARWTGTTVEHCASCHQTFSGTATGERHRVGAADNRRCLTVAEMRALTRKSGALKGQPFYVEESNVYGTVIWREYRPDLPPREPRGKDSPGLAGEIASRVPEAA